MKSMNLFLKKMRNLYVRKILNIIRFIKKFNTMQYFYEKLTKVDSEDTNHIQKKILIVWISNIKL